MEKIQFKIGDVVQLKSGGPDMIISKIHGPAPGSNQETVLCQWFGGRKLEQGVFDVRALIIANK